MCGKNESQQVHISVASLCPDQVYLRFCKDFTMFLPSHCCYKYKEDQKGEASALDLNAKYLNANKRKVCCVIIFYYSLIIIKVARWIVLDLRVNNAKSKNNEIKVFNAFLEDRVLYIREFFAGSTECPRPTAL